MGCRYSRRETPAALLILLAAVTASCWFGRDPGSVPLDASNGAAASAAVLLFNGTGASLNDVAAIEAMLNNDHLTYSVANSSELNRMEPPRLRGFRLFIVPGGNFVEIGRSLTPGATANIRTAVQNGLNYLGVCGGAFLAGKYDPPYNGLDLTSGVRFGFYSAERQGVRKAAVPIALAGSQILDQYWEDGPEFTGWGVVAGRYPDGTPAVVEGTFGNGWIVLSGFHPEAPEDWRRGMAFHTPASVDHAYAARLIRAALHRKSLTQE